MLITSYFKGAVIGLIFGIPVGAVGTLVLSRSIHGQFRDGLITGLGSSAADCLYAAIGLFGMTWAGDILSFLQLPVQLLGGLAMISLGMRQLASQASLQIEEATYKETAKPISAFLLGLTNPIAILTFLMAFTALGLNGLRVQEAGLTLFGILTGTSAWWCLVAAAGQAMKKQLSPQFILKISQGLGLILAMLGMGLFCTAMLKL